jgi:hypothetical protein
VAHAKIVGKFAHGVNGAKSYCGRPISNVLPRRTRYFHSGSEGPWLRVHRAALFSQDSHQLSHLPGPRAAPSGFPRLNQGCCNSHFERKVIPGNIPFLSLHSNPVCNRFHACRQGFRLRWFPCLLREFDRNMPVCNTQQGYSPLGRGRGFVALLDLRLRTLSSA